MTAALTLIQLATALVTLVGATLTLVPLLSRPRPHDAAPGEAGGGRRDEPDPDGPPAAP